MEDTVGSTDSLARIVIGAITGLTSLGILGDMVPGPMIASPILGLVSAILLITAYTGKCPAYSALGVNTCE